MNRFAAFIVAGGVAAAVNFSARILLDRWMPYALAIVVAYGFGMLTAFVLNRRFVFTHAAAPVRSQAIRFCVVNAAAILQTLLVSIALADYVLPWLGFTRHVPEIAHAAGIAVPIFVSYLAHKHWTFSAKR